MKTKEAEMNDRNYEVTFVVDQTPGEVFNAVNDVYGWWSQDYKGNSQKLNDEFEVRFGNMHYSKHRITEMIPDEKVVWLTTESHLSFLKNTSEWNQTKVSFTITSVAGKTQLHIIHHGLVPSIECFVNCSNGWNQYLQHSLLLRITTGEGNPNKPVNNQ